ncbi:MAG: AI-2E family transporter [Rhodospirillales bacterium]|nr:AI-2E family transporter [Rhodospirillales bacterium]
MNKRQRTVLWLVIGAGLIALFYAFGPALAPFYFSLALAFVLVPLCDRLEGWHLPRTLAVLVVMVVFALALLAAVLILVPILVQQAAELVSQVPDIAQKLMGYLKELSALVEHRFGVNIASRIEGAVGGNERMIGWFTGMVGGLLTSGMTIADAVLQASIVVVVVFFLLRDFPRIVERVNKWLPADYAPTLRAMADQAYDTLAGFIRGQSLVCLILGTFYAIALTAIGLNVGLLVGFCIGLISFIPYAGATLGLITAMGLALMQFDSWLMIGGVAAIFFVGQAVEGNFLVPVLVGDRVRLHPVWVILGLYLGGALFGFFGVLLAVPITALVGVAARFALRAYLDSDLRRGQGVGGARDPAKSSTGDGAPAAGGDEPAAVAPPGQARA